MSLIEHAKRDEKTYEENVTQNVDACITINARQPTKILSAKDLATLGCYNVLEYNSPVMLFNGKGYTAGYVFFEKIEDVVPYLKEKMKDGGMIIIYSYQPPSSIIDDDSIKITKGTEVTVKLPCSEAFKIKYDFDCRLKSVYPDSMDINDIYSGFILRIHEPIKSNQDNFSECEDTKCVIEKSEENLMSLMESLSSVSKI